MSARPSRSRRLLSAALYVGCAGAVVLALRPMLWAEPPPPSTKRYTLPPSEVGPFLLPPGTWNVLSAERLEELRRQTAGEAAPGRVEAVRSPLLPPGVEPLAVRADAAGRVSAFLTDVADLTVLLHHWFGAGWVVDESHDPSSGTRTLSLRRDSERAVAWVMPAGRPDRVHLLVTVSDPRPEDRP